MPSLISTRPSSAMADIELPTPFIGAYRGLLSSSSGVCRSCYRRVCLRSFAFCSGPRINLLYRSPLLWWGSSSPCPRPLDALLLALLIVSLRRVLGDLFFEGFLRNQTSGALGSSRSRRD